MRVSLLKFSALAFLAAAVLAVPGPVFAASSNTSRFSQGFVSTTTAALQLPLQLVNSTLTKPFPFGVVDGAVRGTVGTVGQMVGGIFDMGAAAAPYAKYAVFFV